MQSQLVVLGLGSNQNAIKNLRRALLELRRENEFKILKVSRIYESEAQLPNDAPESWRENYLNAAVLLKIRNFEPQDLLKKIKNIETRMGRVSAERWAPRIIDLDILFVENFKFESAELTIPHSMLFSRTFAWYPAKEVWPELPELKTDQRFNLRISDQYFWPEWVAILNLTPDSFSDGGKFTDRDEFLKQARQYLADGADYLDIGAESTRPMAAIVNSPEEIQRLQVAFEGIKELKREGLEFKVSLDSRHFETIQYAVDHCPVDLINDVSGLKDPRVLELIKKYKLEAVCMHSLTVPANPVVTMGSVNVFHEIEKWWKDKEAEWKRLDFSEEFIRERFIFDPGLGFGKTAQQNWDLIQNLDQFKSIQQKFFLGYSRKSFLAPEKKAADKDFETGQVTKKTNLAFSQFLRVHNVGVQKKALSEPHEVQ